MNSADVRIMEAGGEIRLRNMNTDAIENLNLAWHSSHLRTVATAQRK
jgi:hypothetical protein